MSKRKTEVVYLGERVSQAGKIFQLFRDKKKETHHFTGLKSLWPGHSYYMQGDTMKTAPEAVEKQKVFWDKNEELEYEAAKEIAKHTRAKRQQAMDLKKPHKDITEAIRLLKQFTDGMDLLTRRRFMEYIDNQLSKRKRK